MLQRQPNLLAAHDLVFFQEEGGSQPKGGWDPQVIRAIREHVIRGGGLFLLGFASRLVYNLALEREEPNSWAKECHEHNENGLGWEADSVGASLFAGLQSTRAPGCASRRRICLLGGGNQAVLIDNSWVAGSRPRNGRVLAVFAARSRGQFVVSEDHLALCEWSLGKGKVLAYGNHLDLSPERLHRGNASALLDNAIAYLTRGKRDPNILEIVYPSPVGLRSLEADPVEHSLNTGDPGKMNIDLWGWQTTPNYQRPGVVSTDYIRERAIDESYRCGANIVEVYRNGYPLKHDEGWTDSRVTELHHHAHSRDMMIQWFPHNIGENRSFEQSIRAAIEYGQGHADSLALDLNELPDGLGAEQWTTMFPMLFNLCVWPYQPSMYFYTVNHLFSSALPNEIDVVASGGMGVDDRKVKYTTLPSQLRRAYRLPFWSEKDGFLPTMVSSKLDEGYLGNWIIEQAMQTSGYADIPRETYKRGGFQFWATQAECRAGRIADGYGGLGRPDWILKQINDQFRHKARVRGLRNVSASAVWWISEVEQICEDDNRAYVYGISQDPIKCAVSANLISLGKGGVSHSKHYLDQRYPYPKQTAFIQNNYFRILMHPGRDWTVLQQDLDRLAHYDEDSCALVVSEPLLQTVSLCRKKKLEFSSVTFQHLEPAGYKAMLQAEMTMQLDARRFKEARTITVTSDSPYVRIRVERTGRANLRQIGSRIALPLYDQVKTASGTYDREALLPASPIVAIKQKAGNLPTLVLMVLAASGAVELSWRPREGMILSLDSGQSCFFEIALVAPEDLYAVEDWEHLRAFLSEDEERVELDEGGKAVVRNPYAIPVTKVLRVASSKGHPYQVYEYGRWSFRGAQPSRRSRGDDFVKCYLTSMGSARVQSYDYIDNVARAGWGCQYTVSITCCFCEGDTMRVTAEVKELTSFLFAPRIQFSSSVRSVKVNGKQWHYTESRHVFLPNRRGLYVIEAVRGENKQPHLARTFALIERTVFESETLTFEARLPEWSTGIPEGFSFFALVRHPNRYLVNTGNAEVLRQGAAGASLVRFTPGSVSLEFSSVESAFLPTGAESSDRIVDYLRRRSAKDSRRFLGSFSVLEQSLYERQGVVAALAKSDVVILNRFYLDSFPRDQMEYAAKTLDAYVQSGKGLFLICNGVRVLLTWLGIGPERVTVGYLNHSVLRELAKPLGIKALGNTQNHSVFQGLSSDACCGRAYSLVTPGKFDNFKRVFWESRVPTKFEIQELAKMHVSGLGRDGPADSALAPSPVLWKGKRGDGRFVAYSCSLPNCYGSQETWSVSANASKFVQNVVRYLARANEGAKICVLY